MFNKHLLITISVIWRWRAFNQDRGVIQTSISVPIPFQSIFVMQAQCSITQMHTLRDLARHYARVRTFVLSRKKSDPWLVGCYLAPWSIKSKCILLYGCNAEYEAAAWVWFDGALNKSPTWLASILATLCIRVLGCSSRTSACMCLRLCECAGTRNGVHLEERYTASRHSFNANSSRGCNRKRNPRVIPNADKRRCT